MTKPIATTPIPCRKGHWFFGSLREFRQDMLHFLSESRRQFGPVVQFRLGSRQLILISDPGNIEEVLVQKNKSFRKHYGTRLLKPILGNGLLLSEGNTWLKQRRLIQPAFSRRFFAEFAKIARIQTDRLAVQWKSQPQRDLYHDMTQLTVRIAARAFLGVEDLESIEEIGDCLELIHADFEHRFQRFWPPPPWLPTRRNRQLTRTVATLTSIIDRMIAQQHDTSQRHDALSLLLAARDDQGKPIPRKLLRDEVMTLLLAGHDTTANALTWTLFLLSQHPDVATRLAGSARQPIANAEPDIQTPQEDYCGAVLKESMRLYPPVYLFGRQAIEDTTIGHCRVRKGCNVIMSQWVVHRDSRFYPDPEVFRPERWTATFEKQLPKYAYLPFGGGPRVCIGKEVALIEGSIILNRLVEAFEITIHDPAKVKPWPTVTLRPEQGVPAEVRSRPPLTGNANAAGQETNTISSTP